MEVSRSMQPVSADKTKALCHISGCPCTCFNAAPARGGAALASVLYGYWK